MTSYYSPRLSLALCAVEVEVHISGRHVFLFPCLVPCTVLCCAGSGNPLGDVAVVRRPCHGFGLRDGRAKTTLLRMRRGGSLGGGRCIDCLALCFWAFLAGCDPAGLVAGSWMPAFLLGWVGVTVLIP